MKKIFLLILAIFFLSVNLNAAKNLYLSYQEVPSQVFKNQKFEVVLKALVTTSEIDTLSTNFSEAKNIEITNPKSPWKKVSENIYENKYFFKIKNQKFSLPVFSVSLIKNGTVIENSELYPKSIAYSDIAKGDERFSNVIAKDLNLKAYKTKQYNNNEALTIIDIDAINSNLKDFRIKNIKEQGISKFSSEENKENLIYYFVTSVHTKKVIFSYYNLATKSIKAVTIPLVLQNELVSTQTDLNPNNSSFEKYKKVAVIIAFLLFFILFIWKRNKFYLIISLIFLILSVIYLIPNKVGYVKKDSYIYILPTKNSTIFFKLEKAEKVEVLNRKKDFIKVMGIENKFIGWIKENNFGKN